MTTAPAALHARQDEPKEKPAAGSLGALVSRSFSASDFARFTPRTALDMVARIPGFEISGGSGGERGLGQASQNILLNGQRVSAKSNDAAATLRRINADDVVRIEMIDGASLDIPGLTGEVANIVYHPSTLSGTFEWAPRFRSRVGHSILVGEVALNGRLGDYEWTASLQSERLFRGNWGPETVTSAEGDMLFVRDEFSRYFSNEPVLAASISRTSASGNVFNLTGSAGLDTFDITTSGKVFDPVESIGEELSISNTGGWRGELGGDYAFGLGPGRLKLIGLKRYERRPSDRSFSDLDGDLTEFAQTRTSGESVVRSEFRWGTSADWQVSVEGAFNSLDSEAELFFTPAGGVREEIGIPGANATITEKRAEAILSYGRPIGDTITLQLNAGGEFSRIAVAGEAGSGERGYWRPKGSALVAWRASDTLTVNAEIERAVGQLAFGDLLAAVDIANDTSRSTNIELVPLQLWRAQVEATWTLPGIGTLNPYAELQLIEDKVETIPISPTDEALGNIPRARTFKVGGQATFELAALSWEGARLNVDGEWKTSSIEDPLLLVDRPISEERDYRYSAELRHDVPGSQWAWGMRIAQGLRYPNYRLDQVSRQFDDGIEGHMYVENKDVAGLTVRATVDNLFDRKDAFERDVYLGRRDGPLDFRESYRRDFGRILELSVKGAF